MATATYSIRVAMASGLLGVMVAACSGAPTQPPAAAAVAPLVSTLARGEAPISLRADDGTPFRLRRLAVRGQVDGFFAMTELDMVFENPEGRVLDGRMALNLPAGARVVRFAVREGNRWHEAEVVPRRAAYDSLVDNDIEPALLADGADGDRLRARLPRIPAGELRVVVGYVEELRGREKPYRLALSGLTRLDELDVRIIGAGINGRGPGDLRTLADGRSVYEFRGRGQVDADIVLQGPELRGLGLRHDDQVIARIAPVPHDHSDPIESLTVLFDTSASQAVGFDAEVDRLDGLLAELQGWTAEDIPLRVICFDQGAETVFEGRISDFGERHLETIRRRGALGASDLVGALRFAGSQPSRSYKRLLVFTDGIVTAGAGHAEVLRAEVSRLAAVGVERVDVFDLGAGGRESILAALSRSGLKRNGLERDGLVLRADIAPAIALRKLRHQVVSGVRLSVPGSKWVYPEMIDGVQADDTVLVYAALARDTPFEVVFNGSLHGKPPITTVERSPSPLLENAWRAAHVHWMEDQLRVCEAEFCSTWRRLVSEASTRHRIVNRSTALVMLEEGDEGRFGLDPESPVKLLALGRAGSIRRSREAPAENRRGRSQAHAIIPEPVLPEIRASGTASAVGVDSGRPTAPPGADRALTSRPDISPKPRLSGSAIAEGRWQGPADEVKDKPQLGPLRRPKDAYDGLLLAVMDSLRLGHRPIARTLAEDWREHEPANILALVALGEVLEAHGHKEEAARAYGSIVDLYPMRPEMRRLAAARLERLGPMTRWLVLDSYGKALRKQAGDPSIHRLFGYALLRGGHFREAFETMVSGFAWAQANARSQTMARVLYEDIGLVAAAWIAARPADEEFVRRALEVQGVELASEPSLRFVLTWDTPISDVDLHVRDGDGRHAFYKQRSLASGGQLYGDVAAGRGIEAFVIDGEPKAYPYNLQIDYFTLDPLLGYGMGKVEIIQHDGRGSLTFDQRPFVVSRDGANVDLGLLAESLSGSR